MQVIPAINAKNWSEAESQINKVASFAEWVHIDVCDGKFTKAITWGSPDDLSKLKAAYPKNKFEIHLMVENPDDLIEGWFKAGAARIIVHVSAAKDLNRIKTLSVSYGSEIMISFIAGQDDSAKAGYFHNFQILSVPPGFAGQAFTMNAIDLIKSLRVEYPDAKIEVDGGINPETAKLVKDAGADVVISASYVLNSADPKSAYEKLSNV